MREPFRMFRLSTLCLSCFDSRLKREDMIEAADTSKTSTCWLSVSSVFKDPLHFFHVKKICVVFSMFTSTKMVVCLSCPVHPQKLYKWGCLQMGYPAQTPMVYHHSPDNSTHPGCVVPNMCKCRIKP